jgi:polysaccharide pyruvyl transferase WcaK-like protein
VAAWHKQTGKPYGFYGVTIVDFNDDLGKLLSGADYVFCRETHSVALLKEKGISCPVIEFAPDATFGMHVQDEEKALAYLQTHGLGDCEFICTIPRLRYTPYHTIRPTDWSEERIHMVESVNGETKERDHAKMREVITTWVRDTGKKVLVCPEMAYQVEVGKELVVDPLPDDVKKNVVWRDSYWLTDEAASVYARAHTIISFEMHSPIIAAVVGTPAFYLRQPTDTPKGQMWRDIGLNDWIFEIDEVTGDDIAQELLRVQGNYPAAMAQVEKAMAYVKERQEDTMAVVGRSLLATT